MARVTRQEHDDCLFTAQQHEANMPADDYLVLNIVASAWASDISCEMRHIDQAMATVARMRRLRRSSEPGPQRSA